MFLDHDKHKEVVSELSWEIVKNYIITNRGKLDDLKKLIDETCNSLDAVLTKEKNITSAEFFNLVAAI